MVERDRPTGKGVMADGVVRHGRRPGSSGAIPCIVGRDALPRHGWSLGPSALIRDTVTAYGQGDPRW